MSKKILIAILIIVSVFLTVGFSIKLSVPKTVYRVI